MKTKSLFLMAIFFLVTTALQAQKALPIEVNGLLAKVPMPQNSKANFHMCTVVTDNSNGMVSVKDAGAAVNDLEATMQKDMTDLANASMSGGSYNSYSTSTPSAPSAEQIAQMQQQAQQMKGMTPEQAQQMAQQMQHTQSQGASHAANPALMQELGKAQEAMGQVHMMFNELSTKASQLGGEYQQKIDQVKQTGNCPEFKVPHADLALPHCDCVKNRALDYYQRRVVIEDEYLQKVNELLESYIPKIRAQIAIVDKAEQDLNYGDAVTIPAFKTQVVGVQQQAIAAIIPLLGISSNAIKDSGTLYTGVENTNNGHLPDPCQ
ncbi:MAG TPA: hypothetical protein VIH57_01985 [Bacteroidales bacterium]